MLRFHCPLIEPDGRGLRLTEPGKVYADYVRDVLGRLDEAHTAASAAADPERGELRIAALTTAGEQILPGLLASFTARHRQVGVRLEVGNRERVRALLGRHEVDLVLGGRPAEGHESPEDECMHEAGEEPLEQLFTTIKREAQERGLIVFPGAPPLAGAGPVVT